MIILCEHTIVGKVSQENLNKYSITDMTLNLYFFRPAGLKRNFRIEPLANVIEDHMQRLVF
jgi:hypothetical protein